MVRTAQCAADFLADDDAAERRRQHDRRTEIARAVRDGATERLRIIGMLQHDRALQVAGTVQPRRQPEVAFEQRTRAAEQIEELLSRHRFIITRAARRFYSLALPLCPAFIHSRRGPTPTAN